jgi:hypothetical protein
MRVTASISAARDVVEIVDTLDVERDMSTSLDEGEVAARLGDLRKLDESWLQKRQSSCC